MCHTVRKTVPRAAESVSAARRWARAEVARMYARAGVVADDVELVVSELVTNAVRADAHSIAVALEGHHHEVIVKASDNAPGRPRLVEAGLRDRGGRGLQMVAALSREWGVLPDADGKTVWAAVAVHPEAAPDFTCLKRPDRRS